MTAKNTAGYTKIYFQKICINYEFSLWANQGILETIHLD